MSSPVADRKRTEQEAFERLATAVAQALGRIESLEVELAEARQLSEGLRILLESFQAGEMDPARMKSRLDALDEENGEMRERLEAGRASVERLLARIRFLEEQA